VLEGKRILTDPAAESADPSLPAFLARPSGAPVYHGFPILAESETDGWLLGVITAYEDPRGCKHGDAFVVAPDGTRAGLVWTAGQVGTDTLGAPDARRWGVYAVGFPEIIRNTDDIISAFRRVLPDLQAIKAALDTGSSRP
jgi:hypothetical protein